jgi:hypothetical protein
MCGLNARLAACFKETLQAFVAKAFDHGDDCIP